MTDSKKKLTALLVEDDEVAATQLKKVLVNRFDMDVFLVRDYPQARIKLDSMRFDVVAVDFTLPGGGGRRLVEEITATGDHPPVILLGGRKDQKAAAAIAPPPSAYVIKDDIMESSFSSAVEKGLAETSLRQAERALEGEQSFIEAALNVLPDTFFALRLDGTGLRWNRRLSEVTGYTDEEIASMTPADFFRGEDLGRVSGILAGTASGELEKPSVEVTLYTKDGRGIPYEYTASLLKDSDGRPLSICGIGRDISERKLAEAEAGRQRDSLEALVGERTELLWEANQKLAREVDERTREQEETRRKEQYYRSIVEYSTDMVAVFDTIGTLLFVGPSITNILGYSTENMTGKNIFEFIHPDDLSSIYEVNELTAAGGGAEAAAECRFLASNGSWRTLEATGRSFVDASGETMLVVNAHDITWRRKAEEELRESRDTARAFMNATTDSTVLIDTSGNILALNDACAEVLGSTVNGLMGANFLALLPQDRVEANWWRIQEVVRTGEPMSFEDEFRGAIYDHRLYPVLGQDGEVSSVAVTARDVTDKKRAEEGVRASRDNLLAFLNATTDFAMLLRSDGTILAANQIMAERFGTSLEELIGTSIYDWSSANPDVQRKRIGWVEEVIRTGKPHLYEDERGGMFFEHNVYPVPGEDGKVERVALFTRDITDRKRVEQQLKASHDNLSVFLNATTDVALLISAEGRILASNEAFAEKLGVKPEDLIGFAIYEKTVVPDKVQSERVTAVERVIETGEFFQFEDFNNGKYFEHRLYPIFDIDGKVDRVAFYSRDITERKQAETAIRLSEAQYRTLVEQLPVVTYTSALDSSSSTTFVSPQIEDLLGVPPEAWTNSPDLWVESIHPDDRERVLEELASSQRSGDPFVSDYRMLASDGHPVYVHDEAVVIKDDAGNPLFMQGVLSDVTARREAELALAESEEKYRLHFENSYDVIYSLDPEFRITTISPSVERVLGYRPEELVGTRFPELKILAPESLEAAVSHVSRVMAGERITSRYAFVAKDGSTKYGEVTGAPLKKNGDIVGVISVARDVTERIQAEEALKLSVERYRSFYALSPDFIYLMDRKGTMIDANPAILERIGMTLEEFRGTRFMDYFAGEDTSALEAAMEKLRAGEEVHGLEVRAGVRPDIYVYEVNASPIFEEGRVTGILSLARDITERKRDEEELMRLNMELEGYAQTVSHDLRTPLSAIRLAGETLQRVWSRRDDPQLDLDTEVKRFGEVIEESTLKVEKLISDLLDLARADRQPIEVSLVDVRETVRTILDERDVLLRDRGVWVELDKDLGNVHANPTHIYQLFGNIIDNAIRHNDSPSPALEVRYLGMSASGAHQYRIKDNGPGIPEELAKTVFMPFVKGKSGDTGIGLAIAEKIVNLYGGVIRGYNNGGAVFEFSIEDMLRPAEKTGGTVSRPSPS